MNEKSLKICNDDINAGIMQKIREKIYHRKTSDEINQEPDALSSSVCNEETCAGFSEPVRNDLASVNSTWDIHN